MKKVPVEQLVEDKYCLITYGLNRTYCLNLPTMNDTDDYLHMKSQILGDATQYTLYGTLILTIPSIVAALFVGSWTDKYAGAKKILMIAGALNGIAEAVILMFNIYFYDISPLYILMATIPIIFSGGMLSMATAFWAYTVLTTPLHMLALRMTVNEIVTSIAGILGTYVGGKIIASSPMLNGGQLHNYTAISLLSGGLYTIALLWTIFMINERRDQKRFYKLFAKESEQLSNNDEGRALLSEDGHHRDNHRRRVHPIKSLFNINNIKEMLITCCKPRRHYVRLQIWLLILSMAILVLAYMGPLIFLFPFVQKIYQWDSETYSTMNALNGLVSSLCTIFIGPLFIKILGFKDTTLALVGLFSFVAQTTIRGIILNPNGFYLSIPMGALGPIGFIGIRSHFSKIVEPDELGKVSSLMGAVDSIVPLIGSAIFTAIFKSTMDTMPGMSFLITSSLFIIPLSVLLWIHFYTVLPHLQQPPVVTILNNDIEIIDDIQV
ncbi:thymic stromal cotransporter homolog, partial [Oppia nitens]|uniref:thymic stromal cotransporter homolog n=1 Tax=Oppia nitens TaxID=1686743 RepID=UPI0023DA0CB0